MILSLRDVASVTADQGVRFQGQLNPNNPMPGLEIKLVISSSATTLFLIKCEYVKT